MNPQDSELDDILEVLEGPYGWGPELERCIELAVLRGKREELELSFADGDGVRDSILGGSYAKARMMYIDKQIEELTKNV